mmetsp:Transcript_13002/g.41559  ORF Transcript_13002/g.41559 Transcript_13002/m.41559 type:complete len:208 (+) Transcript_13002:157-780(+)
MRHPSYRHLPSPHPVVASQEPCPRSLSPRSSTQRWSSCWTRRRICLLALQCKSAASLAYSQCAQVPPLPLPLPLVATVARAAVRQRPPRGRGHHALPQPLRRSHPPRLRRRGTWCIPSSLHCPFPRPRPFRQRCPAAKGTTAPPSSCPRTRCWTLPPWPARYPAPASRPWALACACSSTSARRCRRPRCAASSRPPRAPGLSATRSW